MKPDKPRRMQPPPQGSLAGMAAQASRKAVSHQLPADTSLTIARQLTAARVAARSPRRGAAYLLDGLEAAAHLCRECTARAQHEVVRVFAVEARATLIVPAGDTRRVQEAQGIASAARRGGEAEAQIAGSQTSGRVSAAADSQEVACMRWYKVAIL